MVLFHYVETLLKFHDLKTSISIYNIRDESVSVPLLVYHLTNKQETQVTRKNVWIKHRFSLV